MDLATIKIVLVEDEPAHAELIRRAFESRAGLLLERHEQASAELDCEVFDFQLGPHRLTVAGSLREARAFLEESTPDLVITDLRLPDGTGTELLSSAKLQPAYPVVIITGQGDERMAVEAMRAGAMDYVVKSEATLADMPHVAERALREWNHITERKLAEERALQAERLAAIGQMITVLSHESRNSLQRIQAGVEMLRLDLEDKPDAIDDLARIENANDSLTKLYDELREYAAPITVNRERCDLREIWRLAWANLGHVRQDRQSELREETNGLDMRCPVDEFRIEQVFRNLMENSLAACSDPVEIDIICHDTQHNGAPAVCVYVRDNGPGLTDEQVRRIFEAFFTTKSKGTGLGMAIAQRIIEAHQGTIAVGNGGHGGSEFVITLPREEAWASR